MAIINLVPDMTSNTTPLGVASADAIESASYDAWNAFDRNAGTEWVSGTSTGWIQYQFDSIEVCTSYSIEASTFANNTPKDFTLEASNTGAFSGEEVTLDTQTGITWASYEKKQFSFSNTTAYKYYRINITASNSTYQMHIVEIELLGVITPKSNLVVSLILTSEIATIVSSLTGSAVVTAKAKGIQKSSLTGSAVMTVIGTRRKYDHSFVFVEEVQLARITQNFYFVEKIEQIPSPVTIKRVNA